MKHYLSLLPCLFASSAFADVAVVLDERPGVPMSVESQLVADIAKRTADATVILPSAETLDDFSVIWIHHGKPLAADSPLRSPTFLAAVKKHGEAGHGILLTGNATILLEALNIDTPQTRPMTFANDRAQFGLVPTNPTHPLFAGADLDRNVLWLSVAAYYAFESFTAPQGTILARNPGGPPAPLLEYPLGKGKVLAVPYNVSPLYNLAPEGHRHNFEHLTTNILKYLAGTLSTAPVPVPDPLEESAVALQLAVEHFLATFGEQYPEGETFLVSCVRTAVFGTDYRLWSDINYL